jgi:LPS-assembly lipoprotein
MDMNMMNKTIAIRENISHFRAAIVVTLVLLLGACGFHLRGTNGSIPEIYQHLQVNVQKDSPLAKWLHAELTGMHVQLDEPNSPVLHILAIRPTRQELVGALTEVQVGVEVDFRIEDAQGNPLTATRTTISRRSFQYNKNTVGIQSQQEDLLQNDLYESAAQQIVRQLATGRMPMLSKSAS